jgi:hypothetical protein
VHLSDARVVAGRHAAITFDDGCYSCRWTRPRQPKHSRHQRPDHAPTAAGTVGWLFIANLFATLWVAAGSGNPGGALLLLGAGAAGLAFLCFVLAARHVAHERIPD